ncbi:MAG: hypothetical protein IPK18_02560 [Sphingobacteriales bacterium]|nr:MAG: hypothetical protein IPK18_02560 [Sphingobacteriales bacterium]
MIRQTKTKLLKIFSMMLALLLLQQAHAQTINLEVKVVEFYMEGVGNSNCGNNDGCVLGIGCSQPDPRIFFRVKHSGTGTWSQTYSNLTPIVDS